MIITRKKPLDEVIAALERSKDVAIIGCGRCATTCQTGGEKEVADMKRLLEAKGFTVVYSGVVEAQCDARLTRLALKEAAKADAYVSMSCGSGASALADLTERIVVASNDTMFLGVVKRLGDYTERCGMCGECTITETMGVCVKTRCAKGLLNGPCGGSARGKCEADPDMDCAWSLVVKRLRGAGRLGELKRRRKPRKGVK